MVGYTQNTMIQAICTVHAEIVAADNAYKLKELRLKHATGDRTHEERISI